VRARTPGRARRDDRVACRRAPEPVPIRVDPGGFDLPRLPGADGGTALLSLDVTASAAGAWREPFLEMRLDGHARAERQHFDRGARGVRVVNVSPLVEAAGDGGSTRVSLSGGSLRWAGEAALLVFSPPPLGDATVLVLAPHPDDAEIAAFGLYAGRPTRSWVVTVTAGEHGAMDLRRIAGAPAERDAVRWRASMRVWDSLTIPRFAGVPAERCVNLAFPDGALAQMFRHPDRAHVLACEPSPTRAALRARNGHPDFRRAVAGCTWADLVSDLRRVLDAARPDVIVCPHPVVDEHADHVYTTLALEDALRLGEHSARALLLYVVHSGVVRGYPFGPADTLVSPPPWTGGEWIADSIHSHPLSPELRLGKYLAVEAAHDARRYVDGSPRTGTQLARALRREVAAFVRGEAVDPITFFVRRALRPNEIYFVVSPDSFFELARRERIASA